MGEKQTGTVKWFNSTKGFGFISPAGGGEDLFVHQTSIKTDGFRSLAEGESVEYHVEAGDDGRTKAIDVTGPGVQHPRELPAHNKAMVAAEADSEVALTKAMAVVAMEVALEEAEEEEVVVVEATTLDTEVAREAMEEVDTTVVDMGEAATNQVAVATLEAVAAMVEVATKLPAIPFPEMLISGGR